MNQDQNRNSNRKKNGLKIISVILALLLWFYVVNEGSYGTGQNTVKVDLIYENIPEGMQAGGPEQVEVRLWGVFQETREIKPYIDLEGKEAGVYDLPVKLHPVMGVMFTSVEPRTVSVTLKEMQETIVPVSYNISGKPPAGYQLMEVITEPERCLITGDQETTGQVTSVVCQVDLSNARSISTFELQVSARDNNGQPVNGGLQIVPSAVKVIAVVEQVKGYKEVPLKAISEGEPAAGYRLKEIRLDPAAVQVVGSNLAVEALKEINTPLINIDEADQSFTVQIELEAPEGLKLYPAQVLAEIELEEILAEEEEL